MLVLLQTDAASPLRRFPAYRLTMTWLIILLSAAGGLCELSGLFLVVREIAADRRRAQELFPTGQQPPRRTRRYPPRVPAPGPDPWAQLRPPRSGELEQRVGRGLAMLANAMTDLRKATDAQLDSSVAELRREADLRETEIRSHLGYVLAGSIRERLIGAALLAAGIVLAVAANVVSALT